jgi:hypothetical protein
MPPPTNIQGADNGHGNRGGLGPVVVQGQGLEQRQVANGKGNHDNGHEPAHGVTRTLHRCRGTSESMPAPVEGASHCQSGRNAINIVETQHGTD